MPPEEVSPSLRGSSSAWFQGNVRCRAEARERGLPPARLSVICPHSLPLSDSWPPTPHIRLGGPPLQSPPSCPPHPHLLLLHLPTSPGPLRVPPPPHLPAQSARTPPSPRADLPAGRPRRRGWRGQRRPGRRSPRAGTGGRRRQQERGPSVCCSGQPAGEGRAPAEANILSGSTAAWEEMGPINPHLPLQIGVQAERWKN